MEEERARALLRSSNSRFRIDGSVKSFCSVNCVHQQSAESFELQRPRGVNICVMSRITGLWGFASLIHVTDFLE